MHVQKQYALDLPHAHRLIAQYGWAKVVTCADGVPCATYGFFLLEPSEQSAITVVGHFARADPQAADIQNGLPALLIFDGPHGYISASWYRPETTRIPSTWNHMSVHLHGVPEPLAEQEAFDVLARTLAHHEAAEEEPWRLQGPSLDFAHTLAPATIVFRLTATRVEAKAKLSQGKPLQMRRRIVERLDRPGPHMNMPLASEMRRLVLGSDLDGERTDSEL